MTNKIIFNVIDDNYLINIMTVYINGCVAYIKKTYHTVNVQLF